MMRVLASLEDDTGDRCVDILAMENGFGFSECRRDPEDPHGWRRIAGAVSGFENEGAALAAARATVGWMA